MLKSPVKNEAMPQPAASKKGIVSFKLLKKVAPPLSPQRTSKKNEPSKAKNPMISPIDHLPKVVFGSEIIFSDIQWFSFSSGKV